jgi:hypothetical protein
LSVLIAETSVAVKRIQRRISAADYLPSAPEHKGSPFAAFLPKLNSLIAVRSSVTRAQPSENLGPGVLDSAITIVDNSNSKQLPIPEDDNG